MPLNVVRLAGCKKLAVSYPKCPTCGQPCHPKEVMMRSAEDRFRLLTLGEATWICVRCSEENAKPLFLCYWTDIQVVW